jgi:integrase/recombinase XerD
MEATQLIPIDDESRLRISIAAYLTRYKGQTRVHTASDLRAFLGWCVSRELPPLAATRAHIELYLRWMQEVRGLKPSTVSRRLLSRCSEP